MNPNHLIYYSLSFASVVKAGSFSKAAKQSGISKAKLSRHVSALEKLLGIQLLHRTTRTMALTEQGQQFFTSCEAIEESCAEVVNQLKHDFSTIHGTLKITAPIDFGIQFLPPIIHAFSQQFSNLNVILSLSSVNESLTDGNYDLALRIANNLPDSNLHMRTIMKFKRIICASPLYFNDKTKPQNLEELKNHHCITSINRNMGTVYPQWQFYHNERPYNHKLDKFIEVDSLFAQLTLIKLGTGIGRMPDYFIRNELETGELIQLFPTIETPYTFAYLLYPDVRILPKKTRVFVDFIKNWNFFPKT